MFPYGFVAVHSALEEERNQIAEDRAHQRDQELAQMKEKRVDRLLDFVYFVLGLAMGYILEWAHPLANVSPVEVRTAIANFFRGLFH